MHSRTQDNLQPFVPREVFVFRFSAANEGEGESLPPPPTA